MTAPVKRICIYTKISFSTIGDSTHILPAMMAARERFPQAEIIWLCRSSPAYTAPLLDQALLYVDRFVDNYDIGTKMEDLFRKRGPVIPHCDILIDTETSPFYTLCLRRQIPHDILVSASAGFLLSHRRPGKGWKRSGNFLTRYLDFVNLAKPGPPPPQALYKIDKWKELAATVMTPLDGEKRYIGFAPGCSVERRQWPLERFLALAREVAMRGDRPTFFIGPNEQDMLPLIRAAVPDSFFPEPEAQQRGAPPHNPALTAALAEHLATAVANDSGGGHILTASGIPTIILFSYDDPNTFAPYNAPIRIIRAQDYGGDSPDYIPVNAVLSTLESVLAGNHPVINQYQN